MDKFKSNVKTSFEHVKNDLFNLNEAVNDLANQLQHLITDVELIKESISNKKPIKKSSKK
jgi:hypothetical protein